MSLRRFQSTMLRLIADPAFRSDILARRQDLPADLDARERVRLLRIAHDRGLDINRTLHKGFRLGKLRAMLPLTCQALGATRLGREVAMFWAERPPSSFYFIDEALDFCDFLARRRLRLRYLGEVLAYERATLELERARPDAAPVQVVDFEHDPRVLLRQHAAGRRPRGVPVGPCRAVAHKDAGGRIVWRLTTPAARAGNG